MTEKKKPAVGKCEKCGRSDVRLTKGGRLSTHKRLAISFDFSGMTQIRCAGSGHLPKPGAGQ